MENNIYRYSTRVETLEGDLYTPVSAYLSLRDLYTQSFLMESSDYHGGENSKSFIGLCPIAGFSVEHGVAISRFPDGMVEKQEVTAQFTIAKAMRGFMDRFDISGEYGEYCGLYGYTSFNAVRYLENIGVKDTKEKRNDAPDVYYLLYRYYVVFKGFKSEMSIVSLNAYGEENADDGALARICAAIRSNRCGRYEFHSVGETSSTLTDAEHKANIERCIAHCLRGDTFQVVVSRRFMQRFSGDDFVLYRALRSINPSPYLFYFDFGGFRIFGSSPETHCRVEGGVAYIDPIAGTTKRTGDPKADAENAERLAADPKENAEHVMLVDLARNDLSRNCHDVEVEFYKQIQYYSHVIHLVSRVRGVIEPGVDPLKVFYDTFPAGTLSGAPKVRAMQIISELEPHNRGAYGGCVGYIGFNGDLNQAITIRTFVSRNNTLWFQAGGGITAKSVSENELQEVNNKLAALRKAIVKADSMN